MYENGRSNVYNITRTLDDIRIEKIKELVKKWPTLSIVEFNLSDCPAFVFLYTLSKFCMWDTSVGKPNKMYLSQVPGKVLNEYYYFTATGADLLKIGTRAVEMTTGPTSRQHISEAIALLKTLAKMKDYGDNLIEIFENKKASEVRELLECAMCETLIELEEGPQVDLQL